MVEVMLIFIILLYRTPTKLTSMVAYLLLAKIVLQVKARQLMLI